MINVLAAPTEIVLSSSHYARTYRLLREFDADDVSVAAYVNRIETDMEAFPQNVVVHSLDKPNRISYFSSLYQMLYRVLRSNKIDVYHHMNFGFREFNPVALLPSNSDVPFLIGPAEGGHAVPSSEFKRVLARQVDRDISPTVVKGISRVAEPVVQTAVNPLREWFFSKTLKRADRIIAVHSDAKRKFGQYTDEKKIDVIPYGVDMEKFPYEENVGGSSFVTIGNLIERKGHRHLLDAMTTVVSEFPEAKLHIVGTGPLREELEAYTASLGITDAITFHGFVDEKSLIELLHESRAFVHPSLSEGFSHVRLEAMSAGCPVIGTDVAGAHDLTRDGVDGIIVSKHSPEDLADALLQLLGDEEHAKEMGKNARAKIERDHDYQMIAQRYLEIYRDLTQ